MTKKQILKVIVSVLIAALTALAASLGLSSCNVTRTITTRSEACPKRGMAERRHLRRHPIQNGRDLRRVEEVAPSPLKGERFGGLEKSPERTIFLFLFAYMQKKQYLCRLIRKNAL